jgi:hypothetical protein
LVGREFGHGRSIKASSAKAKEQNMNWGEYFLVIPGRE